MIRRELTALAQEALLRGKTVHVRLRRHPLSGGIGDGDWVTLQPCEAETLVPGDMVLARVHGQRYAEMVLHQVLEQGLGRLLIDDNPGGVDGWVPYEDVYGRVTGINLNAEPSG